jgi:hypothetical protein
MPEHSPSIAPQVADYLRVASGGSSSVQPPMLLLRQAVPREVRYRVQVERSEFTGGPVRPLSLATTLGLRVLPHAANWQCRLRAGPADLQKPDPTSFDEIALLLSGLYAELVVETAPTGEHLRLLNLPAVRQRWAGIEQALRRRYPAPSEVLAVLLPDVARHLAHPDGLYASLSYNYAYAALLGDFYQQPFAVGRAYTRPRGFPGFYDGLDLHFTETLLLAPADPDHPGRVVLHLVGAAHLPAMRLAAIAARIQEALGHSETVVAEEIIFAYQATHCLAQPTGLPLTVELTVSCTYRDRYHKAYSLTIQATPSP